MAQDLSNISEVKPVTINGGASFSQVWYGAQNINEQRPPYFWVLNANLNINLYSVAIPFSATFTSQNNEFAQPFNQFGISPKYKWITGHLGFRSMQFSEFTLGGLIFLGAGVEIDPEKSKWKGKAMYGRLTKAIPLADGSAVTSFEPAYERWGYAAQVGYKLSIGEINATMFRAKDDANSIFIDTLQLNAQENFVWGINTSLNITDNLNFQGEFAHSAYTYDVSLPTLGENSYGYSNNFRGLIAPNASTVSNGAGTGTLTYNLKGTNLGFTYRRVGPNYRSMGAVYLNNDLENYTFNVGTTLLQKKMTLGGNFGIQRNNLSGEQLTSDSRIIGSVNSSYQVSKKIMVSGNYSNFRSANAPAAANIQDTIRFLQLTNNYGLLTAFSTGNENLSHGVNLAGNYQKADAIQDNSVLTVTDGSEFYNAYLAYNLGFPKMKITFTSAVNYNRFVSPGNLTEAYGPTLGANKQFWKDKLAASLAVSYIDNFQNTAYLNNNISFVYSLNFKVDRFNSIRVDGRYLTRQSAGNIRGSETQFGLTYGFNF